MDNWMSMDKVEKIDHLFHAYQRNIDWIDYENVADVENVDVARKLNKIYHTKYSEALLNTSKAFMQTKPTDHDRQGKLILKAMAELSRMTADGLPTHL